MTEDELGKAAYDAYCETRDWKSFKGDPLPQWEQSPEDIRHGWRVAAKAVKASLSQHLREKLLPDRIQKNP